MHFKIIGITLLSSLVSVLSEPPITGHNYQAGYQADSFNAPNAYLPPRTSYNTPTNSYLPPTNGANYHGSDGYNGDHHSHHAHENEVPKSYEFGYSVKDAKSGNDYDRRESSDGNVVRGEYRVQLPDGRTQIVSYHADWQTGFHADVRYEGEARYPEPVHTQGSGYNYNTPDFSGSLTGFHGTNTGYQQPSTAYGPPGYH